MEKVRVPLLAVIFVSVFLFLGRAILAPTPSNSTVPPSTPPAVPLAK